ncbi:MAG: TSUP family transporter [Desulfuromonadales bacterium]|nr:TSUP family transporter [Desulfuromonadales bacterium]MBN2790877.1 TSUP family transporter [Desulfuromonadales bacterium]
MDLTLWHYIAVFFLIGFAGFIDSIAGGGGLISVPTYLAMGMPAELILGTNKCVSSSGTTFAVFRYIRNRTILWKTTGYAILTALVGSAIGASLAKYLSRNVIFTLLLIVIPVLFYLQSQHMKTRADKAPLTNKQVVFRAMLAGFFIGGYDGIFGPGTGTFLLLAFMLFLHMSTREASANARIVNYASNVSAFVYFLVQGRIYWPIALIAITASICGNWLGSGLVINNADRVVVPVFRLVLSLLMLKCAFDLFLA